ncbi:hypothetical protein, partial [Burkholderia cepacia]|uniref:hypothetical protein n=1 Tax=Burkholderia cepacia TaxID=292 RepID=UPI001C8ACB84
SNRLRLPHGLRDIPRHRPVRDEIRHVDTRERLQTLSKISIVDSRIVSLHPGLFPDVNTLLQACSMVCSACENRSMNFRFVR